MQDRVLDLVATSSDTVPSNDDDLSENRMLGKLLDEKVVYIMLFL